MRACSLAEGGVENMARTYDKGSLYGATIGEREIYAFRQRWPASGLGGLRNLYAEFEKRNGDLVDLSCNRRDCHRFDGPALAALVADAQCYAVKKLGLDRDQCRSPEPSFGRSSRARRKLGRRARRR